MKSTGRVVEIDKMGRVNIQKKIRNTIGFTTGTPIEIFIDGQDIVLKKHVLTCELCGKAGDIREFKGIRICSVCIDELKVI